MTTSTRSLPDKRHGVPAISRRREDSDRCRGSLPMRDTMRPYYHPDRRTDQKGVPEEELSWGDMARTASTPGARVGVARLGEGSLTDPAGRRPHATRQPSVISNRTILTGLMLGNFFGIPVSICHARADETSVRVSP